MLSALTGCIGFFGTVTAATQVARGMVRSLGKLKQGDPYGALSEIAGGVLAPVTSAIGQAMRLGEDVIVAATGLSLEEASHRVQEG